MKMLRVQYVLPILLVSGTIGLFQNCAKGYSSSAVTLLSSASCKDETCTEVDFDHQELPVNCIFNGGSVANQSAVTAFLSSTGDTCVSEQRLCDKGVLGGTYQYASCTPNDGSGVKIPAACLFDGRTIGNGTSIIGYVTSTPATGQACKPEVRTCNDGVLSGSYPFAACLNGRASCLFDGRTLMDKESVPAFMQSTVPFNSSCSSQTRVCMNGILSGSYTHSSCKPEDPATCRFNDETVPHNGTKKAFVTSSVAYGLTCISETRSCNNGMLSGSDKFPNCAPDAPKTCPFGDKIIPSGGTTPAYLTSTVPYGQTCQMQTRSCSDGTLSGSYTFPSCVPGAPAACPLATGSVPHGNSVVRFAQSSVAYNAKCVSETRTCTNGSLTGSYTAESCAVASPRTCSLAGQTLAHGESRLTYYTNRAIIEYNQSCETYTRTATCADGTLTGSPYSNLSCVADHLKACVTSAGSIPGGSLVIRSGTGNWAGVYLVSLGPTNGRLCSFNIANCGDGVLTYNNNGRTPADRLCNDPAVYCDIYTSKCTRTGVAANI